MSEDYTKLVTNLLKRHNLNVTNMNNSFSEYSTIKVSFDKKLTCNLIIWRKKISSAAEYSKLYARSLNKDKSWIIVTKSLINENQIDMMEKYSCQTNRYIKISCVDEFQIINHLKEL
ncbi:7927_t:CDS:1, partial [Dentiscutata erythropus]